VTIYEEIFCFLLLHYVISYTNPTLDRPGQDQDSERERKREREREREREELIICYYATLSFFCSNLSYWYIYVKTLQTLPFTLMFRYL